MPPPTLSPTEQALTWRETGVGVGGSPTSKGRWEVGPETPRTQEGVWHKDRGCPLRCRAAVSSALMLLSCL